MGNSPGTNPPVQPPGYQGMTKCKMIFYFSLCHQIFYVTTSFLFLDCVLMKVKEESDKAGIKLNNQKTKIMASSPITSWQTNGGKMEAVTDFIFLGSKTTADSDCCSHEIKRHLLLGRKSMRK